MDPRLLGRERSGAVGVACLLSGVTVNDSFWTLILAAAVFGVLNTILKPILEAPHAAVRDHHAGPRVFFVSMFMLWLTAAIVPDFDIDGFWNYVGATVIVQAEHGRGRGTAAPRLGGFADPLSPRAGEPALPSVARQTSDTGGN